MGKFIVGVLVAFVATIVAAKVAFEAAVFDADSARVVAPWSQDRMEFVAWNNQNWTAWIRDGSFELVPENTNWSRHANPSLAFIDWEGEPWQAKIDGDEFIFAHQGDWQGETERGNAIRYRDWLGRNQLRTVAQLRR